MQNFRFSRFYSAYSALGFHLGAQPPGAKAGNGHKPGDFGYVALSPEQVARYVHNGTANVSIAPVKPYVFLDVDGPFVAEVQRALGMGCWYHRTASGSHHVLVELATERLGVRNDAIKCERGVIDVKGWSKGYVLGPGSRTEKGEYTGRMGRIATVDDHKLDVLLALVGGKVKQPEVVLPTVSRYRVAAPGKPEIEGAMKALELRLPGEFPSKAARGGADGDTYTYWTAVTWALCVYAGEALRQAWEAYSVDTGRLTRFGTSTFASTWRNTPPNSGPGVFCAAVNRNARARGIESPLPPPRTNIAVGGWDLDDIEAV